MLHPSAPDRTLHGAITAHEVLLAAIRDLSLARDRERIAEVVRRAARELTGADGVTFVVREGDRCFYLDEEAIAPLWKGQRFPVAECISGWVMVSRQPALIADIFDDSRIPHDVYRTTFVKSLAMVPVRPDDPIAAIGAYWASRHETSAAELEILEALAGAASLALANVELHHDLTRSLERERGARAVAEAASRAEERGRLVAEAEERLRRIIDCIADAIVVVDGDGVVKFANPAAGELFGRPREEVIGDYFGLPLVAGETTEVDLKGGRVAEMRLVELTWDEEPAWLASLRDVTARREAEEAARRLWRERTAREEAEKERARLEDLLARAPAAIVTTRGSEHVCAFANPRMAQLAARRPLRGRPLAEALPELVGQRFLDGFSATYREGAGRSQTELPVVLPAAPGMPGRERWLDVTWEPLQGPAGVDGVLCFAYDVTEQVAIRRELEVTMERLHEEERAKDHFLAVLGHELRNPLAGIASGLQLLEMGASGERARWSMTMMGKQVAVLAGLLDDLFDVSAVARGKLELQRQELSFADVVESAVASVRGRLEERQQHLSIDLPDEPLIINGDPRRLAQVLANLLVNASKYSAPSTAIELGVRQEEEALVVEVADRGAGIPEELLEQVFEPFVQGESGLQTVGGLGIGLTLVRQLVELHGGTVTAASPGRGEGSTFTVRLPMRSDIDPSQEPPSRDQATEVDGRRILVVEDNREIAHALGELLSLHGCEIEIATTGEEGVARARADRPDAVLLDLDLPDISGFEVAERLRAEPALDGLLIVAVSGFGHQQARERSRTSGIDHHLVKPVDLDRLIELVNSHAAG
jgi:signal transduction histidine kinase/ActR/RegA family two-component response regulator